MPSARALAPLLALASPLLALLIPRLLRSPRSRVTAVLQRVLRAPAILAAGFGAAISLWKGPILAPHGALLGATLAHGAGAFYAFLASAPATVLARVQRSHAWFGAGVGLAAFGATRLVLGKQASLLGSHGSIAALTAGTLLLAAVWIRDAGLLHTVLRWGRDAKPIADPGPLRAAATMHLGVGDERWVVDERSGAPYRDGRSGEILIVGRILPFLQWLARILRIRCLATLTALVALHYALLPEPKIARHPAVAAPEIPLPPAPPEPPATDVRTWISWYPQPGPIIEDIDRDGTEDVVGLRWDSGHEAAALSVIATSGKTFRDLWRTESIPAQWYSRATHLVRSGETLFWTDSEGLLRVLDLRSGALRATVPTTRADKVCAATEGPDRLYLTRWDSTKEGEGLLVDAWGNVDKARQPKWCPPSWRRNRCPRADGAPCVPAQWPSFINKVAEYASPMEEAGVGVATAHRRDPKGAASRGMDTLFGYDPETRAKRWESPIPFTDEPLHDSPSLRHTMRAGRFFTYYQLRSGKWILGARDGRTGGPLWVISPPRTEHGTNFDAMVATPARVYLALDSRLEVFDAASGKSLGVIW